MSMKEAFYTFFEEMTQNYMKKKGTLPKAPYNEEKHPTGLFMPDTLDDNGYAQWQPVLQEQSVSFEGAERVLGFTIHQHIKDYLSAYWFLALDGRLQTQDKNIILRLDGLTPYTDFNERILSCFDNEQNHYLTDHRYFLIGSYCVIGGNDSYLVHVNNDTGEVTAVEVMDKRSIKLADSIENLLYNMKGIWKV